MNNGTNGRLERFIEEDWINRFENEMKSKTENSDKWVVIINEYCHLATTENHKKYEQAFHYLYGRMKALAKYDLVTGSRYLLMLARRGTVRELTSNPKLLSLRSAASYCMNELYAETKDNFLALILGIAYYESSIPLPVGYARGRDLAVKYFIAAQKNLDTQSEGIAAIIKDFISNLSEYENFQKYYESFKWKGDKTGTKTYLKCVKTLYEPLKDNFLYDFILRELVNWYGYCEKYGAQYQAVISCMKRYPGDETLPALLDMTKKRRMSFGNILKNIPFIILCLLAVLIIPVFGALFVIAFFDSVKAGVITFFGLLIIRLIMIKESSGDGIDGSVLDFMEGFFWGRM